MARFKVTWSRIAENEFLSALEYHVERNGSTTYSEKLMENVTRVVEQISLFPRIGRILENGIHRAFVIDRYLLVYRIEKEKVVVIRFWHGLQDPESLLSGA